MTPRETFLHACAEISAQLDGFRLLQKGQVLKKDLSDKDTVCEIRFQGSRNNGAHNIIAGAFLHQTIQINGRRPIPAER